jgi:hypothetical protein
MKTFITATGVVFGLFTMQALAADPEPVAAEETTEEEIVEEIDCSPLEGDAKTECEAQNAEALAAAEAAASETAPAEAPAKGGKAKRSNTNRMEAEMTDE